MVAMNTIDQSMPTKRSQKSLQPKLVPILPRVFKFFFFYSFFLVFNFGGNLEKTSSHVIYESYWLTMFVLTGFYQDLLPPR